MLTKEQINEKLKNQKSRLKYFRELNNLSIDKICRDTGVNRNTYLRLERDPIHKGTVGIFMTLAEYYGTSIDYIIGNDVEPTCIINYINKRTIDEINYKKDVYEQLASVLTDEGLDVHDLTDNIINLLNLSEKEINDMKQTDSVIPNVILAKKAKKTYPYNLLAQMFGPEGVTTDFSVTKALISELDQMLDQYLTEPEAYVLRLRYINELKLEDIANLRDVTRERIRQIEAKALRRLRHVVYTQSLSLSKQIANRKNEIKSLETQIQQIREKMGHVLEHPYNTTIEELPLSVREFNRLKRAGVNNVHDILRSINNIEIMTYRSLGLGSINNIINVLQKLDYLEKDQYISQRTADLTYPMIIKRLTNMREEIALKYKF
jgi:RNA polymerase sigma factor